MAKRYYWLKLPDDFFQQKTIKKLRRLAGGDTFTVIYLKMLLIAMKQDGMLYFDGVEETFWKELALEMDEAPEDVELTASYLLAQGLMVMTDNAECSLPECAKMTGSESSSAERMRRLREKKASQCDIDVTPQLRLSDGEKEIEKEIDINSITHYVRNTSPAPEATPKKSSKKKTEKPKQKPVITIPLNDGSEHPVYQSDIDEYKELYPAVDIMQELRKMRGWSIDNPKKRKTKSGARRFIGNWLSREQDKGGKKTAQEPATKQGAWSSVNRPDNDYSDIQRQLIQKSMGGD